MKAQLAETGIPVAPRRIEHVTTPHEAAPSLLASVGPLHHLTGQADPDAPAERPSFGGEPETGPLPFVLPDGEARFANSGTGRGWTPFTTTASRSPTRRRPVSPTAEEYLSPVEGEPALGELGRPSQGLGEPGPAAFAGYTGPPWPDLLDRWLF
ncbi:hypothetical protein ABZ697_21685 [Streptomyces albidoflavus]|uniref:hypothetical protein n=1 Tax=Streptomyces albidoflavus TaxID=1886 RepID=UPI0033ED17E9